MVQTTINKKSSNINYSIRLRQQLLDKIKQQLLNEVKQKSLNIVESFKSIMEVTCNSEKESELSRCTSIEN